MNSQGAKSGELGGNLHLCWCQKSCILSCLSLSSLPQAPQDVVAVDCIGPGRNINGLQMNLKKITDTADGHPSDLSGFEIAEQSSTQRLVIY